MKLKYLKGILKEDIHNTLVIKLEPNKDLDASYDWLKNMKATLSSMFTPHAHLESEDNLISLHSDDNLNFIPNMLVLKKTRLLVFSFILKKVAK